MRRALVFATRRAPWPLDNGSRIRSHRLLTGLAASFETTLVTFEHHPDSPDGLTPREELEELLPGIEVVTVPGDGPWKRLDQALTLHRSRSWKWGRYATPAMCDAVAATARRTEAAIVHHAELGTALCRPSPGPLNVYDAHNVEHRIIASEAEATRGVRRAFARREATRIGREEPEVWRTFPLSLACSEIDAAAMRAAGAPDVEIVPNGTDEVAAAAPPVRAPDEPLRILFLGSGSYPPYERGVAWFVTEVLPRVRAVVPATLDVVGRPPQRPVAAEGVEYRGRVPETSSWYERAHVLVVPVFEGSGTRLKIVEGMAHFRPVVSTALGAEGLPVRAGEHYAQVEDVEGFTRELVELAGRLERGDPEVAARLERARAAIEPLFWPNIVANLVRAYDARLEAAVARPA